MHEVSDWVVRLARLGYASKGIVYAVAGAAAVAAGLHRGEDTADRRDVLLKIGALPFGHGALLVIAVGLAGYALWRISSGITDSDQRGSDAKGIAIRIGSIARGLLYAAIAIALFRFDPGKSSDAESRHWTAKALEAPFGKWLVIAAGVSLMAYAAYQLSRALRGKLSNRVHISNENLIRISAFGIAARAIIFGIIGVSLIRAALRHSAQAAQGTEGAMQQIEALPFGGWALALIGLGLISYGVYAFINARYRYIQAV